MFLFYAWVLRNRRGLGRGARITDGSLESSQHPISPEPRLRPARVNDQPVHTPHWFASMFGVTEKHTLAPLKPAQYVDSTLFLTETCSSMIIREPMFALKAIPGVGWSVTVVLIHKGEFIPRALKRRLIQQEPMHAGKSFGEVKHD